MPSLEPNLEIYAKKRKGTRLKDRNEFRTSDDTLYLNCNFNDFKFDVHLTMILFILKTRVTPQRPTLLYKNTRHETFPGHPYCDTAYVRFIDIDLH